MDNPVLRQEVDKVKAREGPIHLLGFSGDLTCSNLHLQMIQDLSSLPSTFQVSEQVSML